MTLHQLGALHHLTLFLSTLKQGLLTSGSVVCLLLANVGPEC